LDENGKCTLEEKPLPTDVSHAHVGVFPQKQHRLNYIGVAIPVGQIPPKQLLRLADLADNCGSGEIRLTVWQNLILPNIPDAYVETVKKALVEMGLHWQQSNLRGRIIACTGNSFCNSLRRTRKGTRWYWPIIWTNDFNWTSRSTFI
jgi:ferredoxin-nitrite reductase